MITYWRITDLGTVRGILSSHDLYPHLGDDFTPPVEQFEPNDHPAIWYVGVRDPNGIIGIFSLFPENTVCWQVHVAMFPWAGTQEKWEAARTLPEWLNAQTDCRRLTAAVPASNRAAIIYGTHGIGMRYVGRHSAAVMKGGKLQDLILLGLSIGRSNA